MSSIEKAIDRLEQAGGKAGALPSIPQPESQSGAVPGGDGREMVPETEAHEWWRGLEARCQRPSHGVFLVAEGSIWSGSSGRGW